MLFVIILLLSCNTYASGHDFSLFIDNNVTSEKKANIGTTYSNNDYFSENSLFSISYFTYLSKTNYSTIIPSFKQWLSSTSYSYMDISVSYTNGEKYLSDNITPIEGGVYKFSYIPEYSSVNLSIGGALLFLEESVVLFNFSFIESKNKYFGYKQHFNDGTIKNYGAPVDKFHTLEFEISHYILEKTFTYDTELFWSLAYQKGIPPNHYNQYQLSNRSFDALEVMFQSVVPLEEYYIDNFFKSNYLFNYNVNNQFYAGSRSGRSSLGRGIYTVVGDFGIVNMLKIGYKKSDLAAIKKLDLYGSSTTDNLAEATEDGTPSWYTIAGIPMLRMNFDPATGNANNKQIIIL